MVGIDTFDYQKYLGTGSNLAGTGNYTATSNADTSGSSGNGSIWNSIFGALPGVLGGTAAVIDSVKGNNAKATTDQNESLWAALTASLSNNKNNNTGINRNTWLMIGIAVVVLVVIIILVKTLKK